MVPVASWKDTAAADSVDSGERNRGRAVLLFLNLFHVFWCENKRGKFKGNANSIQRCLSPNSCPLILLDSLNFIPNSGGVAAV